MALIIFLLVMMPACNNAESAKMAHHNAVIKGYSTLPIAQSMRGEFGAWSFITHWNIPNDGKYGFLPNEKEWQSITFIHDRYSVAYVQRVLLEKNAGNVIGISGTPRIIIIRTFKLQLKAMM